MVFHLSDFSYGLTVWINYQASYLGFLERGALSKNRLGL